MPGVRRAQRLLPLTLKRIRRRLRPSAHVSARENGCRRRLLPGPLLKPRQKRPQALGALVSVAAARAAERARCLASARSP